MKPKIKFYSDGKRAVIGNMITPYHLLTYVMQLKREDDKKFIDNTQGWSINASVSTPYCTNKKTGMIKYVKQV